MKTIRNVVTVAALDKRGGCQNVCRHFASGVTKPGRHNYFSRQQFSSAKDDSAIQAVLLTPKDFEESYSVMKFKSVLEVLRAIGILQLCRIKSLVAHSNTMLTFSRKYLGNFLTDLALRPFYQHFCGGNSDAELSECIRSLQKRNVLALISYAAEKESDSESNDASKGIESLKRGIKLLAGCDCDGIVAAKLSSLTSTAMLEQVSRPILKSYKLFVEAKMREKNNSLLDSVSTSVLRTVLDETCNDSSKRIFQKEDKEVFDNVFTEIDKSGTIHWRELIDYCDASSLLEDGVPAKRKKIVMTGFKINEKDIAQLRLMRDTLFNLAEVASRSNNVQLHVDAEYLKFEPIIDRITLKGAIKFNKDRVVVAQTYQCYLKSCYNRLIEDFDIAKENNIHFGAKLVRGAYMDHELEKAKSLGYERPICDSVEETSNSYTKCMTHMLKQIAKNETLKHTVLIASHSEETAAKASELLKELAIPANSKSVNFAQLLGMGDHLTYTLAHHHYRAFKYVPYGTLQEAMPYLLRRAQENSSMMKRSAKESKIFLKLLAHKFNNLKETTKK
eukprot:GHVL01039922.1.p1 GENE.GHVL01039922.1~~GHVL01039922.1.p1  ORF type:complete len:560 (+),score=68.90 GHVL01039922.1:2103-3782(+)